MDIEFKKPNWNDHRRSITIWISQDEKELHDLLRDEYGVAMSKEMKKAVLRRMQEIREQVVKEIA